jgi:hypothetical protein
MNFTLNFKSIQDLVLYCRSNKKAYTSARRGITEFNTLDTWEDTLYAIRNGWPEGLKHVVSAIEDISIQLGSATFKTELIPSIQGLFFDIGLVCSGEPEHWLGEQESYNTVDSNKIINIGINATVPAGTQTSTMIERGAAILVLANILELKQYSVSITQYCSIVNNEHTFNGSLILKQAGQALDIDSLTFWLVCPDALRRCWLRVMESAPYSEQIGADGKGYGKPVIDYGSQQSDIFLEGINRYKEWDRYSTINWINSVILNTNIVN